MLKLLQFEPLNALGMLNGKAAEFDFNWCMNVGSAVCFTMAIRVM